MERDCYKIYIEKIKNDFINDQESTIKKVDKDFDYIKKEFYKKEKEHELLLSFYPFFMVFVLGIVILTKAYDVAVLEIFPFFIFGFIFFIVGFYISCIEENRLNCIILFIHGLMGLFLITISFLNFPLMTDNPTNIYIYLSICILLILTDFVFLTVSKNKEISKVKNFIIYNAVVLSILIFLIEILPFIARFIMR